MEIWVNYDTKTNQWVLTSKQLNLVLLNSYINATIKQKQLTQLKLTDFFFCWMDQLSCYVLGTLHALDPLLVKYLEFDTKYCYVNTILSKNPSQGLTSYTKLVFSPKFQQKQNIENPEQSLAWMLHYFVVGVAWWNKGFSYLDFLSFQNCMLLGVRLGQ